MAWVISSRSKGFDTSSRMPISRALSARATSSGSRRTSTNRQRKYSSLHPSDSSRTSNGAVRVSMVHYNSGAEIDRLLGALERALDGRDAD